MTDTPLRRRVVVLLALAQLTAPLAARPSAAQQPFDSATWDIRAAESRIEPYRGRAALLLRDGAAWLTRSRFLNGTIEFDVAFGDGPAFPGVAFRAASRTDYELFYMRAGSNGRPDATQYTPVLHGLYGWQIYTGPAYDAAVRWTFDRWMHVKLVVAGTRAEVFVDSDTAVQVIPRLRGAEVAGEVGFVVAPGSARFANVVVRAESEPRLTGTPPAVRDSTPATIVRSWRVSPPFAESSLAGVTELAAAPGAVPGSGWCALDVEERGIANLARLAGVDSGRNTVVAAVTLDADHAMTARVRFGFSDRVRVFLNGRLLYAGNASFATRDPEFLGTVGLFDELALPLRRGPNELWLAVSETFGGWAITADLPERRGIRVSP
ncbi:hypothetical protein J421_5819 (plasmid) [Gemmatirosa kalamazoonensis]|uniref:3-keto-disaccharide hydrolase domain-containing protein n=1 Tax=Gemmatirosa kalamazoonensis TaxID=861299 RepID=W0RQU2_9BACT|nr:hypothetical protein [Gemmatirosa kalamazoonensis]AHG93354.1 hypothetical protein J421_5819 [Gemmatirosa kalamazoonensis]